MNENDERFLYDMAWFWRAKRDMERCSSFDRERLAKFNPQLLHAWDNYKLACSTLDNLTKD